MGNTKWGNARLREDVGVAGNAEWGIGGDQGEKGRVRKGAGLGNNAVSTVGNLSAKLFPGLHFEGESGVSDLEVRSVVDEMSESDEELLPSRTRARS